MTAFIPGPEKRTQRQLVDVRARRHRGPLAVLGLLLFVLLTSPAAGELVVFTHGGYLKVASFERVGQTVHLELLRGGRLQVPLLTVERIIEDEVSTRKKPIDPPAPTFDVHFDEAHQPPPTPFGEMIYEVAKRHQLNPALVAAVARAESNFDARAVSHKGAQGLMQLMPATAQRFGVLGNDVFEPSRNLDAGSRYLKWLAKRFDGRLSHVLAAYNSGEGTVDRYGGVPPYKETQRYIRKIFAELGLPDPATEAPVETPGP